MIQEHLTTQSKDTFQQNVIDSRSSDLFRLLRQGDRIIKQIKEKTQTSLNKDKDSADVKRVNCTSLDSASARQVGRLRASPNSHQNRSNHRNSVERLSRKPKTLLYNDQQSSEQHHMNQTSQRFQLSSRAFNVPLQKKLHLKLPIMQCYDVPTASTNYHQSSSQLKKTKEHNKQLQDLVLYLQNSLKEYQEIISRYRKTIEQKQLDAEIIKQHSSIIVTKFEQQTRKLGIMLDQKKKRCYDLEKAMEDIQKDNQNLRNDISHLHQKISKKVKKMKVKKTYMQEQINARFGEYQKQLEAMKESKLRLEKEYSLLESHLNKINQSIQMKDNEISRLKSMYDEKCTKILTLQSLLNKSQSTIRLSSDAKIFQQNKILLSTNEQLYNQTAQISLSKCQQNMKRDTMDRQEGLLIELGKANLKIINLQEKLCRLNCQFENNRMDKIAQRLQIQQLKKIVQIKDQQIKQLRKNNYFSENKIKDQQSKDNQFVSKQEMQNQIMLLTAQNQKLTEYIQRLQIIERVECQNQQQANIKSIIKDSHEQVNNFKQERQKINLQKNLDKFNFGYAQLQKKTDFLDRQLQNLKAAYQHDQSQKKQLEKVLQETKRQNGKLRQQLQELNQMYSHMCGQMDTLHINRSQNWEQRLEDKGSMENLLKLRERQIGQLQEKIKLEIQKYNRLLENSTAEFDSLMGLNCELSEKLLTCSQQLQNLKVQKHQLEQSSIMVMGSSKMSKNTVGILTGHQCQDTFQNQLIAENKDLKESIRYLKRQVQIMEDDIRFESRRNNHLQAIFTKGKFSTENSNNAKPQLLPIHEEIK